MKAFISFSHLLRVLLESIIQDNVLHAKWLNTLSFLENCGARKIAACEHPTLVKEEMLKHAAEEFRHAYHLKRQIERIPFKESMDTYSSAYLLGNAATRHYLSSLDLQTSRYLKACGLSKQAIRETAYLLVTYAIELRASELYPIYDEVLKEAGSKVAVKSILLEEKEHLREMEEGIQSLSSGFVHAEYVCNLEGQLCRNWIFNIEKSCHLHEANGKGIALSEAEDNGLFYLTRVEFQ